MCKRISWTIRIQPKYKRQIAIDSAKKGQSVATTLETILAQYYTQNLGEKHEA